MTIRSILTFRPGPEQAERILDIYRRERLLQESLDLTRQIRSDIAVATDGSGELIVTAEWPDEEGYQEWLDHPQRSRMAPVLQELLQGAEVGVGRLYRVDHVVSRD